MLKFDSVALENLSTIDINCSAEQKRAEINRLLGATSGLMLDSEQYERVKSPAHAHFSLDSRFEEGRDQSRHQVQFGKLVVHTMGRSGLGDLVAVKPNDAEGLFTELGAINYLNSFGDTQNSYLPLGVMKKANGAAALVTLFEHGITSADITFWANKDINPEQLRPDRIKTAFHDCSWSLGYMHSVGLVHGDAEVKNLAHDDRNARFIDLEDARILPRTGKQLLENSDSQKMKYQDLDTFIASSVQVEENRPEILKILSSDRAGSELGLYYRKGMLKGARDSGLKSHKLTPRESTDLFDNLIRKNINNLFDR